MPSISKTVCCADRSILALLSAYQEYLVTFKLMTSQVVKKKHDHSERVYAPLAGIGLILGEESCKKTADVNWDS